MEQTLEHQSILDMGAGKGRWKPSDDQLRVLMKLFEEEVGTINKQRIKEITAELSQQGHITEANVHNWFHNRKARAKRKQKIVQRDGESEVDTDVESSKGKRPKSEQDEENLENGKVFLSSHRNGVSPDMKLSFKEVQQSDPSDVLVHDAEYRKPIKFVSSSLNLKSRVSESPTPAECQIVKMKAEETSQQGNTQEYYKLTGRLQDPGHLMRRSDRDVTPPDAWRMNTYSSKQPYRAENEYQNHDLSTTDSVERSSDSKTITDDASTESKDIEEEVNKSKSWTKEGMTMVGRRQREQKRNNRRENADRRDRIRNVLNNMRTSSDTYDRDLKALFIEIVNRLGVATARSILDGYAPDVCTPQNLPSSPCQSTSSASCSSTPSLPSEKSRSSLSLSPSHQTGHKRLQTHTSNYTIRIVQRPNPSSSDIIPKHKAKSRNNATLQKLDHSLSCPTLNQRSRGMACQDHAKNWEASPQHGPEVSPLFRGNTHQGIGSRDSSTGSDEPFTTAPVLHSAPCRLDIDIDPPTSDKDDYRIVWSDKNREREMEDYEKEDNILEVKDTYRRDDEVLSRSERRERLAKIRMDGSDCDRTTVTVVDGKPIGANGSWWNSLLRYSALLFLDISIPHIALQPEDGIAKIREYMDTKFDYNGGPIDDNYLKKQIARALNFKRHKVMRLIEQGGKRPGDVSEDQWDALTRYWSDPRRREKSERQRAALKALSINGGVHGEARQIESTQSN